MASDRATSALRTLWKYQKFFIAIFIHQEKFQEWALSYQELAKPLSDALLLKLSLPASTTNDHKALPIPKINLNYRRT